VLYRAGLAKLTAMGWADSASCIASVNNRLLNINASILFPINLKINFRNLGINNYFFYLHKVELNLKPNEKNPITDAFYSVERTDGYGSKHIRSQRNKKQHEQRRTDRF
jgi:hypothetical protein